MASKELYAKFSDNFLTCHICLSEYKDPRVLQCYHTFCLTCIANHAHASQVGGKFQCPVCREEITIPTGGLDKLVHNFFLNKIKDFMLINPKEALCSVCKTEDVQLYCHNCKCHFCAKCQKEHHDNQDDSDGHAMSLLPMFAEEETSKPKELEESLQQIWAQTIIYCEKHPDEKLKFYCESDNTVLCCDCLATDHKKHHFVYLEKIVVSEKEGIEQKYKELLPRVSTFEKSEKEIEAQQKKLGRRRDKLQKQLQDHAKLLHKNVSDKLQELSSQLQDQFTAQMKALEAEKDSIQLQKVSIQSTCEFAKQLVRHGSQPEVMTHAKNIQTRMSELKDFQPAPIKIGDMSFVKQNLPPNIFGKLKEPESNFQVLPSVSQKLKIQQKTSPSSRPSVTIATKTWVQATLMKTFDIKLSNTHDISCSLNGNFYLTSLNTDTLKAVSESGENVFEVKVPGARCVTCLSNDRVVVTNVDGCMVYTEYGNQVRKFGQGDMTDPWGVTVDNSGHILVCDGINKCICIYNAVDYILINKISIPMCEKPVYINVNPKSNVIIVSDNGGHCVYGVTLEGDVVFQYGTPGQSGQGEDQLYFPCGICVDRQGHIFVADSDNHRVVVLTQTGKKMRHAIGKQQIKVPVGVDINREGELLVAEFHGKVKLFQCLDV
ncbi:tripartite motif-containing protein 2-like [Lingula anatina]|uniref:Tripartite motif-containing protein 2-like n=1 Tax=Lingula anatina TaxID=7574 RepID=A0A2R2MRE1_LINAN|nr:tripartite motif-containing protein 2-like [Lingula anatina]|eukprot:XP_023932816.1 tripartite motif-containing protein 2-like [Lingula anatina]